MDTRQPVTPTIENYLKTIYLLQQQTGDARLADIADGMAVSRPSANRAVALLTERSMAEHEKFGPIRLTPAGIAAAERLLSKYETIKRFLMHILHLSEELASTEACAIEHTICDVTLRQMAALL